MKYLDFDKLQKTTLEIFLSRNPHIKEKETMSSLVDTMSKLMSTMLCEYHNQVRTLSQKKP